MTAGHLVSVNLHRSDVERGHIVVLRLGSRAPLSIVSRRLSARKSASIRANIIAAPLLDDRFAGPLRSGAVARRVNSVGSLARSMKTATEDGACLRRKIAGREVPRRWAGDGSEDESARDQKRVPPQRADACLSSAALREAGAILLLDRARRGRTTCPSRSDPQVSCRSDANRARLWSLHKRKRDWFQMPVTNRQPAAMILARSMTLAIAFPPFIKSL